MKKIFAGVLALVLCLGLCACGGASGAADETTKPSVEALYTQLVEYATNKQYAEAKRLYIGNPELKEYQDAQDYYQYCVVIDGYYQKGRIGYTYRELSKISKVLETEKILSDIQKKLDPLQGEWKEDNGKGSYLYLAIKDGYVATDVVSYYAEDQSFTYTEDDFLQEIVEHTYTDGTVGLAIKDSYALTYFADDQEIMLIKFADASFDTFNGVYEKIK